MGWFTKTVEVEKVVEVERIVEKEVEKIVERPVPGDASRVNLYRAYSKRPDYSYGVFGLRIEEHGLFLSCADAFKAHPGCEVHEQTGIRIGAELFAVSELKPVTVTKPKRDKGKAKA